MSKVNLWSSRLLNLFELVVQICTDKVVKPACAENVSKVHPDREM